jgi:CheY-like chemotaxis protein
MGGEIGMTSREGEGTQVRVVLCLERVAVAAPPAPSLTEAAGLRVLLAEDDRVQQIVLVALLEARGCVVDVAGDGLQALALWREHRHRLVLSDCRMPGHDGWAFARALRREAGGAEVRLAGMSADADDAQAARAAGMDTLLQKPLAESAVDVLLAGVRAGAPSEPQVTA